ERWNEERWNEERWNEERWNEERWNEERWNEERWNEERWNGIRFTVPNPEEGSQFKRIKRSRRRSLVVSYSKNFKELSLFPKRSKRRAPAAIPADSA
ncbi:MAG: hypothetical protein LBS72_02800, partial [Oscillospiraceae bacterium]|nr:hypothetical protein [Oscillospiraceae bacterium]